MVEFIIFWLITAVLLSIDNSISLFSKYDIPLNFMGGFSVPSWRIKEVIKSSEDKELVNKFKKILIKRKVSKVMLFIWVLSMLLVIYYSQ